MFTDKSISRRNLLKSALTGGAVMSAAMGGGISETCAALYNPNVTELVQFIKGDLPLLICVPYGGNELVFGIPARTNIARPVPNFTFAGVVWTYEIAMSISRTIERLSGGKKPYMVLNLAHRRYLDVNREDSDAYEVTLNAPRIYWEYHDAIREFVNQMNILYDNPFLLEISGHNDMADLIIRRTLNGKSVSKMVQRVGENKIAAKFEQVDEFIAAETNPDKKQYLINLKKKRLELASNPEMIKKFGNESFTGEKSLIGEIQMRGYKIDPEIGIADIEIPQTTAGDFTIDRYGSHQAVGGMDAIQLVVGSMYRTTSNYMQTGRDIGNALWNFSKTYNII
jgi:hypothetical protein